MNGPDGYLWYTQAGTNGLGRLNLDTFQTEQGQIFRTDAADPSKVDTPAAIIAGPGGTLWFSEVLGNRIGLVTAGASPGVTLFDLPTSGSGPAGLAAGPDGAIWFTELPGNKIGRLTVEKPPGCAAPGRGCVKPAPVPPVAPIDSRPR